MSEKPTSAKLGFIKSKDGKTYRLYSNIAIHYKTIANTLGIDYNKITLIERGSEDYADRVQRVFQEWFQNANQLPNGYELSWTGLRKILEDSDLANVAQDFFEVLQNC